MVPQPGERNRRKQDAAFHVTGSAGGGGQAGGVKMDACFLQESYVSERIRHPLFRDRLVSAEAAAERINPGMTVAMSGFTGAGYPKAVPQALARRVEQANAAG